MRRKAIGVQLLCLPSQPTFVGLVIREFLPDFGGITSRAAVTMKVVPQFVARDEL
jgi:hypothetical protein